MLKERDMLTKGLAAFRDCLSVVPSLVIDSIEAIASREGPDYRACIRAEGVPQQIIYLEINTLGTPKSARAAVNSLLRKLQTEGEAYGVFVAPYISPSSAGLCADAGIGTVDLAGNCRIAFQQVFISREKMRNPYSMNPGLKSIYSPKSERILRVLLAYPYQPWRAVDLAEESQVSLGMITQVSKKLIEEEWLKKTQQGIVLTEPDHLLADWVNNYTLKRSVQYNFYTLKPLLEVESEIAEVCDRLSIPYALTGFSASNRLAPIVRGQRAMIYIQRDVMQVAEKVGLKSVESGANITLIQPYDDGVFWNAQPMDDLRVANPVQVYLDLKRYPGRGEEAADFLYREVIDPRWQQQKMNMTTSS